MLDKPVLLYGPPGVGKSTVGRLLAAAWEVPFTDLDAVIARRAGKTVAEIFTAEGEAGFRRRERAALLEALTSPPGVIALGGGALLADENRLAAETHGRVLLLDAPPEILRARLAADDTRPLLSGRDGPSRLTALLAARKRHYDSFGLRVATEGAPPAEIVLQIQTLLGYFHLKSMGRPYDVRVAADEPWPASWPPQKRAALVSDARVGRLHAPATLERLQARGVATRLFSFRGGERAKTLRTATRLWQGFLDFGLERGDLVIGQGGGITTDLAGFAASAYLRGVDWAALPTSLLGMVDAAVGGKTGVDLPQGKNLVGAFWPPRLVWADVRWLDTLPRVEKRNGLAEVLKHGLIADPELFQWCRGDLAGLQHRWLEVVRRAVAVKVRVIEADPYENGLRQALNAGHTLGHALEAASGYRLRHGEAVGIGLRLEAQLAENLGLAAAGLAEQVAEALAALGLPTRPPAEVDRQAAVDFVRYDKKRRRGRTRFALPVEVGRVEVGVDVPDALWQQALLES